jgi:hypothetical protein
MSCIALPIVFNEQEAYCLCLGWLFGAPENPLKSSDLKSLSDYQLHALAKWIGLDNGGAIRETFTHELALITTIVLWLINKSPASNVGCKLSLAGMEARYINKPSMPPYIDFDCDDEIQLNAILLGSGVIDYIDPNNKMLKNLINPL